MEIVKEFYDDLETQAYYAGRVELLIGVVRGIYGKSFNLDAFLPKVRELARCEIAIRYYSKLLANHQEADDTHSRLRDDRQREAVLWTHLGLSMSLIEKSSDKRDHKEHDNFDEHLMSMMDEAEANGEFSREDLEDDDIVRVVDPGPAEVHPENEPIDVKSVDIQEVKGIDIKKEEVEDAG